MWNQSSQSLDFSEIVDLIDSVEMVLYALDSKVFGDLDALSLVLINLMNLELKNVGVF